VVAGRAQSLDERADLPAPSLVWNSAVELAQGELWSHLWISLQRLLWGCWPVSAPVRCWVPRWASAGAERLVFPTFAGLAQVPTLAWIPLFMVFFGIGEVLKLVVLVKAIVVPVTLHTLVGVRDAQPKLREAAAVLRLPSHLLIRRLVLPAALPAFMAGVRLALAAGWTSLLAVELLASSEGIGYLMVWARQLFMLDIVFVCIVVIGVLGVAMDRGIGLLDRNWCTGRTRPRRIRRGPRYQGWQRLQPWLLPLA
jgi:sulfonate transport system permease protein